MSQELQVIQDCYDLSMQVLARVQGFPRNLRHGLGRTIEQRIETILAGLIRAKYAVRAGKGALLRDVNIELEVLRFQLRQAVDLKGLSLGAQRTILEAMEKVGRQVGAWIKSLPV